MLTGPKGALSATLLAGKQPGLSKSPWLFVIFAMEAQSYAGVLLMYTKKHKK